MLGSDLPVLRVDLVNHSLGLLVILVERGCRALKLVEVHLLRLLIVKVLKDAVRFFL